MGNSVNDHEVKDSCILNPKVFQCDIKVPTQKRSLSRVFTVLSSKFQRLLLRLCAGAASYAFLCYDHTSSGMKLERASKTCLPPSSNVSSVLTDRLRCFVVYLSTPALRARAPMPLIGFVICVFLENSFILRFLWSPCSSYCVLMPQNASCRASDSPPTAYFMTVRGPAASCSAFA